MTPHPGHRVAAGLAATSAPGCWGASRTTYVGFGGGAVLDVLAVLRTSGSDAGVDVDAFCCGVELGVENPDHRDGGEDETSDPDQARGHFASLLGDKAVASLAERDPGAEECVVHGHCPFGEVWLVDVLLARFGEGSDGQNCHERRKPDRYDETQHHDPHRYAHRFRSGRCVGLNLSKFGPSHRGCFGQQ